MSECRGGVRPEPLVGLRGQGGTIFRAEAKSLRAGPLRTKDQGLEGRNQLEMPN